MLVLALDQVSFANFRKRQMKPEGHNGIKNAS